MLSPRSGMVLPSTSENQTQGTGTRDEVSLEWAGAASLHSRVHTELDVAQELFGLAPELAAPNPPAPSFAHTYFLSDQHGRSTATPDTSCQS